jgi:hypothetical protein
MAPALIASPVACRQYIDGLKLALDRATTCDELVTALYETGAYFGAHGGPEAAGLLWTLADAVRDSLNGWGEVSR